MSELDVIGTLFGTDKCSTYSWAWDYLPNYEELLGKWRYSDINLIEIGVAGGASLRMWRQFFERATLVGIDVNPDCLNIAADRMIIKIGSQEDPSFLQQIASEYPPTIVIDDGSHIAHHMITSFETLFPRLLPGGVYVFEDMSFHFEDGVGQWRGFKDHQGLSDTPIYEYLSRFIRARAANITLPKASWGFSRYAFENIDSVLSFGGAIVVKKRAPRDFARDVELFERAMQHGAGDAQKERYAHYLVTHDVYRDRAVVLLREVLNSNPDNVQALTDLFHVLDRLARLDEAAQAVGAITRVNPSSGWAWQALADTQRKRQRPDLESQALERVISITQGSADARSRLSALYEIAGNIPAALVAARKALDLNPNNPDLARRVERLEAGSSKKE